MFSIRFFISVPIVFSIIYSASAEMIDGNFITSYQSNEVTVTATREETLVSETPDAISVISQKNINFVKPSHPQEIMSQIPGVSVNITNGEGSAINIRQGFTTSPVYLFLEDGIPTRATGNFNHNALYEVNIPGSGGLEVTRGIGSALYGSDAIGGTINVLTKKPSDTQKKDLSIELGGYGYKRMLGGFDTGLIEQNNAFRGDINLTSTDGWRNKTGYERQSMNLRWDNSKQNNSYTKTIFGYTHIDQETGANSALPYEYYANNPKTNLRSIAYRKVDALRISSSSTFILGDGEELSFTPYLRNNQMNLLGSYNLPGDARVESTDVNSFGLMTKYRKNFNDSMRSRLITGIDIDYSPSKREENSITTQKTSSGLYTNYASYTIDTKIYDYNVNYKNLAPYIHYEFSPSNRLRIVLGGRYDLSYFDMENNLSEGYVVNSSGRYYYQRPDTSVSFNKFTPKVGATFQLSSSSHLFVSYKEGFRTPTESQIFRGGRSTSTESATAQDQALALSNAAADIKPIEADEIELGLRGKEYAWDYEFVAYHLRKTNDLLTEKDSSGASTYTNNGETLHRGVEFGVGRELISNFRVDLSGVYAKHEYEKWVTSTDYSGNEIAQAPKFLGNLRFSYQPEKDTQVQLEVVKVGSYYLDDTNLYGKYKGYNLFNLRAEHEFSKRVSGTFKITNLADKRYADSASSSSSGALYSPALPRTLYLGLDASF